MTTKVGRMYSRMDTTYERITVQPSRRINDTAPSRGEKHSSKTMRLQGKTRRAGRTGCSGSKPAFRGQALREYVTVTSVQQAELTRAFSSSCAHHIRGLENVKNDKLISRKSRPRWADFGVHEYHSNAPPLLPISHTWMDVFMLENKLRGRSVLPASRLTTIYRNRTWEQDPSQPILGDS